MKYLLYSIEGYTESPNSTELDNVQILSFIVANNLIDAQLEIDKLLPELLNLGFSKENLHLKVYEDIDNDYINEIETYLIDSNIGIILTGTNFGKLIIPNSKETEELIQYYQLLDDIDEIVEIEDDHQISFIKALINLYNKEKLY